jgi:hypothetical protein
MKFLAYIISKDHITMFKDKVEVIKRWESPKNPLRYPIIYRIGELLLTIHQELLDDTKAIN